MATKQADDENERRQIKSKNETAAKSNLFSPWFLLTTGQNWNPIFKIDKKDFKDENWQLRAAQNSDSVGYEGREDPSMSKTVTILKIVIVIMISYRDQYYENFNNEEDNLFFLLRINPESWIQFGKELGIERQLQIHSRFVKKCF